MKPVTKWTTYSNVTATVALFIALGGGAWAALGPNSVGPNAIKKNAVRSQEIDNETIKAKDVKPGTLGANQIADGSIGTAEIADGAVGSGDLAGNAVVADTLANGAVVNSKLADNAIGSGKIANGAVGASEIENGAVGKPEVSDDAVGSAEVIDGSLNGGDIGGDSLGGAQINESSLGTVLDAQRLGGRELVSVVGDTNVANDVLLTLPRLGAELRTDGDTVDEFEIVFENVSNPGKISLACPGGSTTGLSIGGTASGLPDPGEFTMLCYAWDNGDLLGPSRTVILCAHFGGSARILCDILRTP